MEQEAYKKMRELIIKIGLGQRKHSELMEDFCLETPLE